MVNIVALLAIHCINRYRRKGPKRREYFRLGADSYSSLGRVGKREEINVSTFGRFRLWISLEYSPAGMGGCPGIWRDPGPGPANPGD